MRSLSLFWITFLNLCSTDVRYSIKSGIALSLLCSVFLWRCKKRKPSPPAPYSICKEQQKPKHLVRKLFIFSVDVRPKVNKGFFLSYLWIQLLKKYQTKVWSTFPFCWLIIWQLRNIVLQRDFQSSPLLQILISTSWKMLLALSCG